MSSDHQKRFIRSKLMKGESMYVVLASVKKAVDIGFIDSNVKLNREIAAFAAEFGADTVRVSTGRNMMNVDGPSAVFKIKIQVT